MNNEVEEIFRLFADVPTSELQKIYEEYKQSRIDGTICDSFTRYAKIYKDFWKWGGSISLNDSIKVVQSQFFEEIAARNFEKAASKNPKDNFRLIIAELLDAFPGSKILSDRGPIEFLANERTNSYFILGNCNSREDVDCKVLEYLSRDACKSEPFKADWRNERFHEFMLNGICDYFEQFFSKEEMELIYTHLGNGCNHELTKQFIRGGFDMRLLKMKEYSETEEYEKD